MPELEGKSLGRYELRRLIGKGGMANVYEAFDALLGQVIAVKVFKREDEELLRPLDPLDAALQAGRRLHVGDHPHRSLEEEPVGQAVEVAADPSALRVRRVRRDGGGGEGRGVGDPRVPAALVDEARSGPGDAVKLPPVRLAALGQFVGAVAHAVLPLVELERPCVRREPLQDVVDSTGSAEVGGKPRQAVVDDMRVGVVETRQDRSAIEVDDPGPRSAQSHHLAAADGSDATPRHRKVGVRLEAGSAEGADAAPREDQVRFHRGG